MMFTEPLSLAWIIATSAITILGVWLIVFPGTMPEFVAQFFVYGKLSDHLHSYRFIKFLQVPKQWFTHFYMFAAIQNVVIFALMCGAYFGHRHVPQVVVNLLDFLAPSRTVTVESLSAFLAVLFITLHTTRRVLECIYLSVYSGANMNVLHYLLGFMFYFGVTSTVISEAPAFQSRASEMTVIPPFHVHWYHVVGTLLYVFGMYHHHTTHVIFANLRKDPKGKVVTKKHVIPHGGLFEYVSCPHYFSEILIYLALGLVLCISHRRWWLVVAWVVNEQVITAILTHNWYLEKYKDYPKTRTAIIPFIL